MSSIFQTVFTQRNDIALPGTLAEAYAPGHRITTKFAKGLHLAGYGVFKAPGAHGGAGGSMIEGPGQSYHQPIPGVAASANAIVTTHATSASQLVLTGAGLNGATGGLAMQPARKVTLTLSSHADWNATNVRVTGVTALGAVVTETLAVPDAGNTVLTTTNYFLSVSKVDFDAQGGTGGSFTVGVAALSAGLTVADVLGVVVRDPMKTGVFASNLYALTGMPSGAEGNYIDTEMVPVLSMGAIWVFTEVAVADQDPLYVRVAAGAGGSVLGAFRNDSDSSTAVLVPGRFTRSCAAGVASAFVQILG